MHQVFISYRRGDGELAAGLIHKHLARVLGPDRVSLDSDVIPVNAEFSDQLYLTPERARVVLAVIGPEWGTVVDASGRPRLGSPDDFVHRELAFALRAGKKVNPIYLDDAQLLEEKMSPRGLKPLARQCHVSRYRQESNGQQDEGACCGVLSRRLFPSQVEALDGRSAK
jgi:hypothetical protein